MTKRAGGNPNINNILVYGALLIIFLLGLVLRMGALSQSEVIGPIRADAAKYLSYAHNLTHFGIYSGMLPSKENVERGVIPDATVTPGYPLFISLFLDESEPTTESVVRRVLLVQTFLSASCVLLVFFMFKPLIGHMPGLAVALLTAFSPHLVNMNIYLLTEALFGFLLLLWVMVFFKASESQSKSTLLIAGALLAVTALTRSWIQYLWIFIVPLMIWGQGELFKHRSMVTSFLVGFGLVFLTWIVRNLITLDSSGDNTLMLATLHHGMYPGFMYDNLPESFGIPYHFDPDSKRIVESLSSFLTVLFERFLSSPYEYLSWYLWGKAQMVLSWDIAAGIGDIFVYPFAASPYIEPKSQALFADKIVNLPIVKTGLFGWSHGIMKLLHGPLVIFAFLGAAMAWVPSVMKNLSKENVFYVRLISTVFFYFILVHMIAAPFPRYSIPMRPLIYGLAIFAITIFWIHVRSRLSGDLCDRKV